MHVGLLVSGGGTPLEPCRVAPYVSVPRLSAVPRAPPPPPPLPPLAPHPPPPAAFAPFDSALLSAAAHQVTKYSECESVATNNKMHQDHPNMLTIRYKCDYWDRLELQLTVLSVVRFECGSPHCIYVK